MRSIGLAAFLALASCTTASEPQADLIINAGRAWTGDSARPWAESVAIRGDRIAAVGSRAEIMALRTAATRVIDVTDRFLAPGFIDNHTHFNSAGALLLGANLLDTSDEAGLIRRVREARDRLPEGAWITGGDWGAYESWARGATGREEQREPAEPFRPHRALLDSITPETPVLINRWDRSAFLANGRALELAGADCSWSGIECASGSPTGRLDAAAAARVRRAIPPKPLEQRLAEARAALHHLAALGVTTIHDITPPDQLDVYQRLLADGELTTRIYARPTLDKWDELRAAGIGPGFGNEYLKIGGLKGFVDGIMGNSSARFYEPYLTTGVRGSWRTMMTDPPGMLPMLLGADSAGFWPQVHAIGDEAIDTLLDMFEHVIETNGPQERRFRVIHTQVMRGPEVAERMARLGIIAEVQPYHTIDDMRWMEERIGERSRWAYAFRTLKDAGVTLSFGSDWPGTNAAWYTADPLKGMYAAVTRQTLDGEPAGGWFPEERIDLETALRAYTVTNAWVAGEENLKGSLTPGKLADLVVIDRDPFGVEPAELKDLRVLMTFLGGTRVYDTDRPTYPEQNPDAVQPGTR
jgi:predicted amidohydrolase YtcJ